MEKIENPEGDPHIYGHVIYYKSTGAIQWRSNSLFNK